MKKAAMIMMMLLPGSLIMAQNDVDALRYSFLTFGGTARSMGMGGAFGALGADFSTLSTNPAGIGQYKTSEFTFTPSLYVGRSSSSYNGMNADDFRYNFNVSNLGMVLTFPGKYRQEEKGWQFFQFGFGLNRNNNFNNRLLISGDNFQSSILDTWVQYANGNTWSNLNDFDTRLAFDTWLLDTLPGDPTHYQNAKPQGGVHQRLGVTAGGSMSEWVLSFGGNYSDMLYLGATLGFPFLSYNDEVSYAETALADSIGFTEFRKMVINQKLNTEGSGFNFKFGMIFKPVDWVRIGAAVHTPTYFYNMKDTYSTKVRSYFDNGDQYTADSPEGRFDYQLNTPMRFMGSLAFVIGKIGLVSADYEYLDYSEARFRSDNADDYFEVNESIRNKYNAIGNLRLGTEWRLDQFSFRGGYAMYGSPFKSGINDAARTSYTVGLGVRQESFFLDLAYVLTKSKEDYYLYDEGLAPLNPAKNELTNNNFLMTLGFKF